jgi:hypothetical protein
MFIFSTGSVKNYKEKNTYIMAIRVKRKETVWIQLVEVRWAHCVGK